MLENEFAQIGTILVMATIGGGIALLLRQPVLVAYIVVGIIAGPAVLGLFNGGESIEVLAKVGIAILLFLVGLKLDIHLIRTTGLIALIAGVGQVAFTVTIGYLIAIGLGFESGAAAYIAVALAFSSTIIIVKLLSDKRELDELHGRIAVGILIVQDILVIVAMIVVVSISGGATEEVAPRSVPVLLAGSVVFLVGVTLLARFVLPPLLDWLSRSQELTLLFSVAWAIALAGVTTTLGLSMEIGAFVAGVALASTPYRESIGARLVSLRDIMILFFFIELGSTMSFTDALGQVVPAILLSVFVLVGKPLIVMTVMGLMGYPKKVSFKSGIDLAQISEFSFILIALAYSLGQVDESVLGLITIVGVITITMSTYLIMYADQIYDRLAPRLSIFERNEPVHGAKLQDEESPYDAIVVGAGRLGSQVIRGLRKYDATLLVVDFDPNALRRCEGKDIDTLYGDVSDPDFAAALPLHEARSVVCAVPDATTNVVLLDALHRLDFDGQIWLTAMDERSATALRRDEQVRVIRPFHIAANTVIDDLGSSLTGQQTGGVKD